MGRENGIDHHLIRADWDPPTFLCSGESVISPRTRTRVRPRDSRARAAWLTAPRGCVWQAQALAGRGLLGADSEVWFKGLEGW
jgi:hypothetical protein